MTFPVPLYHLKSFLGFIVPNVASPTQPLQTDEIPSLGRFINELRDIAPQSDRPISPQSHLIDDLEFQARNFERLASLLYRCYGIAGLPTARLPDDRYLTVDAFFRRYVRDVLGVPSRGE